MKKVILLILSSVITLSCIDESELDEKQTLSNADLTDFVLSDVDFISFVSATTEERKTVEETFLSLNSSDKISVQKLFEKYSSYEDFESRSSTDEKTLYAKVFGVKNNKSIEHFNKLISKLEKYNYSTLHLLELIKNYTQPQSKVAALSCESIAMGAYYAASSHALQTGSTFESARRSGEIAYGNAFWGCVIGRIYAAL